MLPQVFFADTSRARLTDIEGGTSYPAGIGRRLTDRVSASGAIGDEAQQDDPVSPLARRR